MRRGGPILLVLVLIIVVLIAAAFFFLPQLIGPSANVSPTAPIAEVVVVGQPINQNDPITDAVLSTIKLPKNFVTEKMITDKQLVIGKYAKTALSQGLPISLDMVIDRPTAGGSKVILPGQVAITIPVKRMDLVGYAVKDGDYVDVIATTLFVDLDASYQSVLPNVFGQIVNIGSQPDAAPLAVLGMNNGAGRPRSAGRAELDPTLNQVIYFVPSESQRPRLVSQMILQDIQVLHVGTFSLADQSALVATPEVVAGQPAPTAAPPAAEPDIITLIVSPQDAVSLNYLIYSGTKLSFALRAPDDRSRAETEAATLQYLLSQYAIPVPAKLPYGIEPRVDILPVFDVRVTVTPRP